MYGFGNATIELYISKHSLYGGLVNTFYSIVLLFALIYIFVWYYRILNIIFTFIKDGEILGLFYYKYFVIKIVQ